MKVSIITVVHNNASTIKNAIESVINQSYQNIEYIVVDGASTDGTIEIISNYKNQIAHLISEPDTGIYNAINKGIKLATGDIVGILNSDDFFCSNTIIERVVKEFLKDNIDAVYGDVQFVNPNKENKITRYYSSKRFNPNMFKYGFMPAHPSFYVKRSFFNELGYYKETYKIGADFELLLRFLLKNNLNAKYLEMPFVTMRTGGISNRSYKSNLLLNREILKACRENNVKTNLINIYSKYFIKAFEFI
ncbi:MAG: glycosyltransferase family 2 protein [Bacteroidales bacterium]|jgi:glycosyltransferase involved in cell wall biosynthesis|nr:glycosyltransferase family 2 protein [Bacteroidales bacterium]